MMEQERFEEILLHINAAARLAEKEVQEQEKKKEAIRPAAQQAALEEISLAFNSLTTYLLYAGMPVRHGNEIRMRISNAVNAALANEM